MKPELLTYSLGEHVCAFSTMRGGGYSEGAYASFNANAYCGDDPRAVRRNRELLCRFLELEPSRLIMPHQVHEARVLRVEASFFGRTEEEKASLLEGVDAVMTDLPRTCVSVSTADCIPVLIYDAALHAVAAVHAGWRSTLRRIPQKALQAMAEAYGTRPSEVRAVIGPGISLEAFEVGDEVYEAFRAEGFPMEEMSRRFPPMSPSDGGKEKWHLDLWRANAGLLESSGVPSESILTAGVCTWRNADRFFSARRLGVRSGRILNGIFLKE